MSDTTYVIKGAGGPVSPRLPFQKIQENDKQWALYIRALALLQGPEENYPLHPATRWHNIGGIHGLPFEKWPGDPHGRDMEPNPKQWLGYCHHASVLFPTWHRISLLLLEQAIWEAAQHILKTEIQPNVSEQELKAWQLAAETLRWPFWDWTDRDTVESGVPRVLQEEEVTIKWLKEAEPLKVKNPLFCWRFNPPVKVPEDYPDDLKWFNSWDRTFRWPTNDTPSADGGPGEDYSQILSTFQHGGRVTLPDGEYRDLPSWAGRRQLVHLLFDPPVSDSKKDIGTFPFFWDQFANNNPVVKGKEPEKRRGIWQSLEQPHNNLHLNIGGGLGHMSYNEFAGFDPIFWLHHANVDRLYAFWEAVYPDYWMGNGWYPDNDATQPRQPFKGTGTYDEPEEQEINESTDLSPFRKSDTEYWTSSDLRFVPSGPPGNTSIDKTYTYPDIVNGSTTVTLGKSWTYEDRTQYREALRNYFDIPYKFKWSTGVELPPILKTIELPEGYSKDKHVREFYVKAVVPSYAFKSSHHIVLLFNGIPINDIAVLRRLDSSRCANCQGLEESGSKLQAFMLIPEEIIEWIVKADNLDRDDAQEEEVVEAINRRLSAKVMTPGLMSTLAEAKPGLLTSAQSASLKPLESERSTELTLLSAMTIRAHKPFIGGEYKPTRFEDIRYHATIIKDDWVLTE